MSRILCLWFPRELPADSRAREQLAQCLERFAPLVGWQTISVSVSISASGSALPSRSVPPRSSRNVRKARSSRQVESFSATGLFAPGDCLFGEVTEVSSLFGGEERLVVGASELFRNRGYPPRSAVADTVGAAWGAVHFGERLRDGFHHARSQSWIVPPGESAHVLRHLPLAALRLSPACLDIFQQLGIEQLEQFAKIPRQEFMGRLGSEPLLRWDQLQGSVLERIVAYRATPEFVKRMWLEHPLTHGDHLQQPVQQLMHALAEQLAPHRRGALRLACRLDGVTGDTLRLMIGFFRPTARVEHWFELLQLQLEQKELPDAIQQIHLEILQTAPLSVQQPALFVELEGSESRQAQRQFENLVDRLSSRLGEATVVRSHLQRDPQPERAFSVQPWLDFVSGRNPPRSRSSSSQTPGPFHRPLRLYDPPRPIQVCSSSLAGPPEGFSDKGVEYRVVAYSGPERIETGWWRGPRIRRDYFRVETTENRRFWLFRVVKEEQWFLQGEFF